MQDPIMTLTRSDGSDVYVVKACVESWARSGESRGSKLQMISGGFQFVKQSPAEVEEAFTSEGGSYVRAEAV